MQQMIAEGDHKSVFLSGRSHLGGGHFELVAWSAGSLSFIGLGAVAIHHIGWRAAVAVATAIIILLRVLWLSSENAQGTTEDNYGCETLNRCAAKLLMLTKE